MQNDILDFCRSESEHRVMAAAIKTSIAKTENFRETMDALLDILARWRLFIGLSKEVSSEEFIIIAEYIYKNYRNLTTAEINSAVELSVQGKLDCDPKPYGSFSVLYCSEILNAYIKYKRQIYNDVIERKVRKEAELNDQYSKPTPQEDYELTLKLIRQEYEYFEKNGVVSDIMDIIYNFFKKSNRMKLSETEITDALNYGKKMAIAAKNNETKTIFDYLSNSRREKSDNYDYLTKKFARGYALKLFFTQNTLDSILGNISITEFQQNDNQG